MSGWVLVIPVKALDLAKSRLGGVGPRGRAALAQAFALDTIDAAISCRAVDRVVVVGDASELGRVLPATGVEIVDEGTRAGLTAAIRRGIDHARADEQLPVAVLLGDLPALTPMELAAGLDAAARHPLAFVPDADGTGTTLATAAAGTPFAPAFGDASAGRHADAGFTDLTRAEPGVIGAGLRRDVDTIEALEAALVEGVGAHTAAVVAALADGSLPRDHRHAPWNGRISQISRNSQNSQNSRNGKGTS
ncbi:2-phospho-L-lactate guanylyltransferase [Agromyces laixinhei]|uniref:2-phospho-L-lactate guanylyltransferase n=1 Tax=Agromyces laixinhei TaxID=2585717 RepID=UPI0012EDBC88|nr:2-phospho-L-lactate guanylyltransferase [Agromyces laixinhei]